MDKMTTPERVAIVGSRDYPKLDDVRAYVATLPAGTVVISGGARGVDRTAEEVARCRGLTVEVYPAEWGKHGKAAGYIRNEVIVAKSDRIVAFWDGASRGTAHTIDIASASGKPVEVHHA